MEEHRDFLNVSLLIRFDDGYYLNSKDAAMYFAQHPGAEPNEEVTLEDLQLRIYAEKLEIFRDRLATHKKVREEVRLQEREISGKAQNYNKMYEVLLNRRRRDNGVEMLRKQLLRDEERLSKRMSMLSIIKENIKKKEDREFFSKVFAAFGEDLGKNQQLLAQSKEKLEMYQRIYVARKIKMLFVLGYVFFNDKSSAIFKKILRLRDIHTTTEKVDQKIANALGFAVMLGIMMAKYLNLSLAFPMIYNGPRSMIKASKSDELPLYLTSKSEKAKFMKGVEMLVQNLLQIISFCGITFKSSRAEADPAIQLPETIICLTNYLSHFFIK